MKTRSKHRLRAPLAAFALLAVAAASVAGLFGAREPAPVSARGRGALGHILTDGSFEDAAEGAMGDWVVWTASAQGAGGTVSVVAEDAEDAATLASDGAQSVHIEANTAQWPEIYQIIEVKRNTDYYITLEMKNLDATLVSQTNVFYGFANTTPENNVDIHQQQRWVDKSTRDFQAGADAAYTPLKAVLNAGNYTQVRFFIRANRANIMIDNIHIAESEPILPPDTENLLKQPGFEGGAAQLAAVWKPFGTGNSAEGEVKMGYDDYRTDADYKPAVKIQNKEIEGYKCLWIAYYAGATENDTYGVYQGVTVEPNTVYTYYVNLGKFKTIGGAEIGVYNEAPAAEALVNQKKLARVALKDEYLYNSCYNLYSVTFNSGDNTTVYPYVMLTNGDDASWAWGAGLLVDDMCLFHSEKGDVPADKENLFQDPNFDLAVAESPWAFSAYDSENGINVGGSGIRGYNSANSVWVSAWGANVGISQLVNLEAGKDYKMTVRVKAYRNQYWAVKSLFSLAAYDGNTLSVAKASYDLGYFTNDYVYDNIFTSTNPSATAGNFAWIPLGLTFTVPADGEYEVFLGFVEHPEPGSWYGGVDVSAPALYEYTAPVVQIDPPALAASDGTVVLGDGTATLSAAMSVGELKGKLSVNEPYLIYVTDASGAEKADSAQVAAGDKVIVKNGDETVAAYSVAISGPDSTQTGNKGCGSCGGGASALFSAAAILAALFVLKKRLP